MKQPDGMRARISVFVLTLTLSVAPCVGQISLDPLGIIQIGNGTVTFQLPHVDQIPQMVARQPIQGALFFLNPLGGNLAAQIHAARDNVRRTGCGPASPQVISALTPFLPASVFDGVCWASLKPGFGLDSIVIHDGGMSAVTLDDTIVFKDSASGFDPGLWAHELIHILQYRRLGVEVFANQYTYNWRSLEDEAYGFQHFVESRLPVQGNPNSGQPYYKLPRNWDPNARIANQEWVQAAKLAINPLKCTRTDSGFDQNLQAEADQVFNDCPLPFTIVSFDTVNTITGESFSSPCGSACIVNPGTYSAFLVQPPFKRTRANMIW